MLLGFVVATKYRLRRQPGYDYRDLRPLIQNLSTCAKTAYLNDGPLAIKQYSGLRRTGQFLGVPGTGSDPLKPLRKGPRYHGNLPLEILNYLSAYMQLSFANGTINVAIIQTQAMTTLTTLLECLTGMERVVATPLPLAYSIAISQITWAYILILPFQLFTPLGWIAIPGTLGALPSVKLLTNVAAAYIILGLAAIGREIEDPFGTDVNDLDMEGYIRSLAIELDILTSLSPPKANDFIATDDNFPLGPTTKIPHSEAQEMSIDGFPVYLAMLTIEIRKILKTRGVGHAAQMMPRDAAEMEEKKNVEVV